MAIRREFGTQCRLGGERRRYIADRDHRLHSITCKGICCVDDTDSRRVSRHHRIVILEPCRYNGSDREVDAR